MTCPRCGAAMNQHAFTVREPLDDREGERMDPALQGVVEEHHTCPACGTNASRPAEPSR